MLLERGHYLVFIAPHLEPAFTANHQLRPARCAHMRRIGLKIARNYPELLNIPPLRTTSSVRSGKTLAPQSMA
jgi:hypothetical protein